MNAASLCDRLLAIAEWERRAGRRQIRETHALSLEERVEAGDAVRGLELVEPIGKDERRHVLRYPENVSRFRVGDLLWLSDGVRIEAGLQVVLRDDDPNERVIVVELDRFGTSGRLTATKDLVLDKRDLDLTDSLLDAIQRVLRGSAAVEARALLLGEADPTAEGEVVADASFPGAAGLDEDQAAAFVEACRRRFLLVQGPPGAGKTRLASAVVGAYCAAGARVLVTGFTHRAVNRLLEAVLDAEPSRRVLKIGRSLQAEGLADRGALLIPSAGRLPDQDGPCVVGGTTHAAVRLLGRHRFDLCLIDEAGQVSLPHACAPLALATRHVLVGDHAQLPPLVLGEHEDPLATRSVFEHLHAAYGSRLLTKTYRMNQELCAFPSRAFYDERLEPAAANATRRLQLEGDVDELLLPDPPAVIVEMTHVGARHVAPAEAEIAAELAARAIALGLDPNEIGLIAPHRAQGNRIRAQLRRKLKDFPPERLPVVDTVERFQGGERDLIILSLTASDPDALLGEAAFFFSPNRLNVSLTRARKKLIVLMSEAILDAYPDDARALAGADVMRRLWKQLPRRQWEG